MNKTVEQIQQQYPHLKVSHISLPENHSLNDMLVKYGKESILTLLNEADIHYLENIHQKNQNPLEQIQTGKLAYKTNRGTYYIIGELPTDQSILKVTIHFEEIKSKRKIRNKIDLYDRAQLLNFAKTIAETEHINNELIEADLVKLTDLLEAHREKQLEQENPSKEKRGKPLFPPEKEKEAIGFLSQPDLINRIDQLIEVTGIMGEENNRKMLFVIASTYKMPNTLHSIVQGISGGGKSHLLNSIAEFMPPEDVINMTRVTSKSFYHYQKEELQKKLILIQDLDGLDEEAKFAFRELQSAGQVSSSTTYKDKFGNLVSTVKTVHASFASLSATTHAEIYYDNMSRSIVMGINESEEQTQLIIQQQNKKIAGKTDELAEYKAKELLQNCMRTLKPYVVVNRYADQLQLPIEAKMLRRLNNHYQSFVAQITILNQYQREKDEQGRLISTVEDLQQACEIMFDAIMWKIDELDSTLRQFFEQLKTYVKQQPQGKEHQFTNKEIRQAFKLSKSQAWRYKDDLKKLEYIQVSAGTNNKGLKYKITYWDDMEKTREKVKQGLMDQLRRLK